MFSCFGFFLFTDGVTSYSQVTGRTGESVRLPCLYTGEITTACWGRGECSWWSCREDIIQTDGYKVTFQKDRRYQLRGYIGERNLTLTIKNADPSDSGLYCCRIEKKGWFNDIIITQELSIRGEFVFLLPLITSCRFPEIRVSCLVLTSSSFNREIGGSYKFCFLITLQ